MMCEITVAPNMSCSDLVGVPCESNTRTALLSSGSSMLYTMYSMLDPDDSSADT